MTMRACARADNCATGAMLLHAQADPSSASPSYLESHFKNDILQYISQPGHTTSGARQSVAPWPLPLSCGPPGSCYTCSCAFCHQVMPGRKSLLLCGHGCAAQRAEPVIMGPRSGPVLADGHLALVLSPRGAVGGVHLAAVRRQRPGRPEHRRAAGGLCQDAAGLCARCAWWPGIPCALRDVQLHTLHF